MSPDIAIFWPVLQAWQAQNSPRVRVPVGPIQHVGHWIWTQILTFGHIHAVGRRDRSKIDVMRDTGITFVVFSLTILTDPGPNP